jgi:hypothetical protein
MTPYGPRYSRVHRPVSDTPSTGMLLPHQSLYLVKFPGGP